MSGAKNNDIPSYIPEDVSNCFGGIPEEARDKIIKAFVAQKDLEDITKGERDDKLFDDKYKLIDEIKTMVNGKKIDDFLKAFRAIKDGSVDITLTNRDTYVIGVKSGACEAGITLYFDEEGLITDSVFIAPRARTRLSDSKDYEMTQMVYKMVENSISS